MDCLASCIPPLRTLLEAYAPPGSAEYAPYIGVALTSLAAVYVGYLYLQSWREAAVLFNVPIPPEVRNSGSIKTWDEVQGQQKMVLQDQARGKWSHQLIMSYCPADGRVLGNGIKPATVEDVNKVVRVAKAAQPEWSKTTFAERRKVLRTLLKYVLDHQDDLVTACCLDSGKTKVDGSFGEILVTVEKLKWTIDHGEKALLPERRPTNFLMMYKKNMVTYEPLGVVGACVSWNYPLHNFIGPIISALFTGNAVVVKPSEQTAWSAVYFLEMVRGALSSCGHSRDLVQTVVCLPNVADAFTSHPDIAHLTFIGSRPVAHHVCASAAKSLIPVCVELGGKDPAVVLDDSRTLRNISSIASLLMRGVFQSSGQNCIGVERIIALPNAYERLIEIVTPRIQNLHLGSVLLDTATPDVGAMISPASFANLESLIKEAVQQGARLLAGGTEHKHPVHQHGHYFTPTLLVDVTRDMRIAQTELFAPVFLMMRAESVSDAIAISNSTPYALGASVFGHRQADVQACVSKISSGMVAVNDFGAFYAVQLPFGGVRGSGYGRFAGDEGLRGLCNIKSICVDRFPTLIGTGIPPRLDYPIQNRENAADAKGGIAAWEMCKGVVETGYQLTLGGRIAGILRLLRNM
ncbi:putative aldehyde dehydrogenase-like protein [Penicillium chrysogenum]|uniref:aldehyde dehydrogenase (NAD(+)) n=2 Tax=Penicillium chrysogenum species complex TaxID=254878 RepID=B6HGX0_PENRW|nr:putative aldehyde dehydrogenase-like protein [Penicillium chrysogenum]CAP86660.1 Pc20g13310 [Penicillium rubens Wisconsin 54-1255]